MSKQNMQPEAITAAAAAAASAEKRRENILDTYIVFAACRSRNQLPTNQPIILTSSNQLRYSYRKTKMTSDLFYFLFGILLTVLPVHRLCNVFMEKQRN